MKLPVAILHGWSDSADSFVPLSDFLKANGFNAVPIWLGQYISMDDDVAIQDAAKGMERAIATLRASGELAAEFDLIGHSTGALVAREWLTAYYGGGLPPPPVKRLVMLAPANFGSRLARTGKSFIGRAFKGFGNGFQTGRRMLDALELASRYSWDLACRDLLVPDDIDDDEDCPYGPNGVLPFVIVGTRAYESPPRSLVNEDGSDGTVRVAAANLNVLGVTMDFTQDITSPTLLPWKQRFPEAIPLAVLPDRDHTSVTLPGDEDRGALLGVPETVGSLVLEALQCPDLATYRKIAGRWGGVESTSVSERTASLAAKANVPAVPGFGNGAMSQEAYHQFMQVVFYVVDDHGDEVRDYFIEFPGSPTGATDGAGVYFQRNVLQHVYVNDIDPARRCLFLDRTDLLNGFYPRTETQELYMRVVAEAVGKNVGYFVPPGEEGSTGSEADGVGMIQIHSQDPKMRWLTRNATHLVKVILPREPSSRVFTLRKS